MRYALVDCNDTTYDRSSYLFLKRYLEREHVDWATRRPLFDLVFLTHGHADHYSGLKKILSIFGTEWLRYSKASPTNAGYASLLRYARRSKNVLKHGPLDSNSPSMSFGDASIEVLWPPRAGGVSPYDVSNENNNSLVLLVSLSGKNVILTGDCEAHNWPNFLSSVPQSGVEVFQVPHHGAANGLFDGTATPWLDHVGSTVLALSAHVKPHGHPHHSVITEINRQSYEHYRTDEHYHVTFRIRSGSSGGTTVRRSIE